MTRCTFFFALLSLFVAIMAGPVLGDRAGLSEEQRTYEADLIVMGKLSDRKDVGESTATATLTVNHVFKGDPALKSVSFSFYTKAFSDVMDTYSGTEEGIWYLKKEDKGGAYRTFDRSCHVSTTKLSAEDLKHLTDEIAEAVKAAQPVETTLAEIVKQVKAGELKSKIYRVEATFEKETTMIKDVTNGKEYPLVQWFLKSGGEKVHTLLGSMHVKAEEYVKSGKTLVLDIKPHVAGLEAIGIESVSFHILGAPSTRAFQKSSFFIDK